MKPRGQGGRGGTEGEMEGEGKQQRFCSPGADRALGCFGTGFPSSRGRRQSSCPDAPPPPLRSSQSIKALTGVALLDHLRRRRSAHLWRCGLKDGRLAADGGERAGGSPLLCGGGGGGTKGGFAACQGPTMGELWSVGSLPPNPSHWQPPGRRLLWDRLLGNDQIRYSLPPCVGQCLTLPTAPLRPPVTALLL